MSSITHANAKFTPAGRLQLVRLVLDDGWKQSRVAERFQCHRATVSKWWPGNRPRAKQGFTIIPHAHVIRRRGLPSAPNAASSR